MQIHPFFFAIFSFIENKIKKSLYYYPFSCYPLLKSPVTIYIRGLNKMVTGWLSGDIMGDKSPKSKDKNLKQKDSAKVKSDKKTQDQKDSKTVVPGKPKK